MARGRFITFEGGEGCGKSTQTRRLGAALERMGVKSIVTREPGGTPLAESVRRLLKGEGPEEPCDRCELLLFLAARAQLVERVIRPALEAGVWVVSDRFSDSTYAYQGCGRGLPLEEIPDRAFEEAASLAAWYSSGREQGKVEIDYLPRRGVKKPGGARPGFVIYHNNYSILAPAQIPPIREVQD